MRRRLVPAAGIALGLALLWAVAPTDPPRRALTGAPAPSVGRAPSVGPGASVGPASVQADPEDPPLVRSAREVQASCDLPIDTRCDDRACAALVTGPDLDRVEGWVRIALERPRFVGSVALRDLGVPADALPCGAAVDQLGKVLAVELDDGREVWCTVDGDDAAGRALCDGLARERVGEEAARFGDPHLRVLAFRSP